MNIVQKWHTMLYSFSDIRAAIIEKGGNITGDCSTYAKGVRSIYSKEAHASKYTYPNSGVLGYILVKLEFCKNVKEEIRRAIIDGGVECGEDVPLSEYGNKIRQIITMRIDKTRINLGAWGSEYTARFNVIGGTPPYKWEYKSGIIPGMTMSEDGTITGTPKSSGAYTIKLQVTDANGIVATGTVTVSVSRQKLYFQPVNGYVFKYDGQPHKVEFVCKSKPDAEFSVKFGTDYADYKTECGKYIITIRLTGNTYYKYIVGGTPGTMEIVP